MRYPIRRSNSRLSFAFQEPTHLGRCFRIHEVCDYAENWLSHYARRKTTVLGRA